MPDFEADREQVIDRARQKGITTIVTIGINGESNRRVIELADKYKEIWAAVGIHPQESKGISQPEIGQLEAMARHPKVVAIGELGLDFFRDFAPHDEQLNSLCWQLELASAINLPVVVHCRQAQASILPELKKWVSKRPLPKDRPSGVLHNFRDDLATAECYLEMGFYISLGAYLGYPSSGRLRSVVKDIPLNKLLIETDCPFLPPQANRGGRNEPAYALSTAYQLAEILNVPVEEVAVRTTENAHRVFKFS